MQRKHVEIFGGLVYYDAWCLQQKQDVQVVGIDHCEQEHYHRGVLEYLRKVCLLEELGRQLMPVCVVLIVKLHWQMIFLSELGPKIFAVVLVWWLDNCVHGGGNNSQSKRGHVMGFHGSLHGLLYHYCEDLGHHGHHGHYDHLDHDLGFSGLDCIKVWDRKGVFL